MTRMTLKKPLSIVAGAAGVALIAAPALAAGPYTVSVDGDTSGAGHDVVATSKGGVNMSFNGHNLPCTGSTISGSITSGASSTGAGVAGLTGSSWLGCPSTTVTHGGTWAFNLTGTATSGDDVIDGTITGINAHISTLGGVCQFDVTGSVDVTLAERFTKPGPPPFDVSQITVTGSHLTVSNVNSAIGCVGWASNGNAFTLTASYNLDILDGSGNPIPGALVEVS